MDREARRAEYDSLGLDVGDIDPDPIVQVRRWMDDWAREAPNEPTAIVLATADAAGRPSARTVLLRGFDELGATFFTNYESRKGRDLAANPRGALLFNWIQMLRQVHLEGPVVRLDPADSDAYFASRPRGSQLAAWASEQSAVLPDRETLEARFLEAETRFEGQPVPRPPHWGGYRLVPEQIELWQGRRNRMHDRLRYERADGGWRIVRLAP